MNSMRDALLKAGQITEDGGSETSAPAKAIQEEAATKAAENMRRIAQATAQRNGGGS